MNDCDRSETHAGIAGCSSCYSASVWWVASLTHHSIFDFKNGFWKQEMHPNASKTFWAPRLDVLLINQLGFLGRGRNSIFFQFFFISFMACKNSVHDEDFPPISNKQIQKQQKISKKQYWYLKCEKIPDCTAICLGPFVFVQKNRPSFLLETIFHKIARFVSKFHLSQSF